MLYLAEISLSDRHSPSMFTLVTLRLCLVGLDFLAIFFSSTGMGLCFIGVALRILYKADLISLSMFSSMLFSVKLIVM